MQKAHRSLISALGLSLLLTTGHVFAQDSSKEADGAPKVTEQQVKKELSKWALLGRKQIVYLTEQATAQYEKNLLDSKPNMPGAWMLMKDGKTVKHISIDDQAGDAPAQVRILMYRAALKSIARRNEITAAVILYTGKVSEDSDEQALVIEHEHRLGISGNKVIPYEVKNGKVLYGEAVTSEKPFQIFYDSKSDAAAQRAKNAK
ncbi:hypothetical protein MSNKSG1_06618 [Marinobacter santoriniensis NKSG1]|uniref:Uncharacterized protein n=1 Tax=Marinobacter santoriniensis NKSG1 TaxID=1288826 RepID=M7D465_9GAMM|nr:hypothetical protein [Marinobacter santoriniensis]EMP55523.1 hypothetical protein MSNKSG1_06618 [Marinobacter santoriniensis NKSG1]